MWVGVYRITLLSLSIILLVSVWWELWRQNRDKFSRGSEITPVPGVTALSPTQCPGYLALFFSF
jgi:hypothetical protein